MHRAHVGKQPLTQPKRVRVVDAEAADRSLPQVCDGAVGLDLVGDDAPVDGLAVGRGLLLVQHFVALVEADAPRAALIGGHASYRLSLLMERIAEAGRTVRHIANQTSHITSGAVCRSAPSGARA